jgi:hypothetical protein
MNGKERSPMAGKVTKDILMRVGKGVMRIPRDSESLGKNDYTGTDKENGSGSAHIDHNQIGEESNSTPCQKS